VTQYQKIVLDNNGLGLAGVLYEPPVPHGLAPAVLMLHGLKDQSAELDLYQRVAQELADAGLAAFSLSFRGTGESEGTGLEKAVESLVSDARTGLRYLLGHPLIDPGLLCVLGHGLGATVSAYLAHGERGICSAALLAPAYSPEPIIEGSRRAARPFWPFSKKTPEIRLSPDFAQEWAQQGLTRAYHELRIPAMLIHGNRDQNVPTSHSHQIRTAMEPGGQRIKLVSIEGGDHWFSHPEWRRMIAREVRQWFCDTLDGWPRTLA